ncbi:HAD-IA family hydrolase [archaeon]|jgi:FMN phosphatase YigB (HAD superfamily)|nr:HAD-IA family hydrolase [archaeon]MBT6698519.1 HAD-IA family hydrolase [archaeon]
MVKYLLFDWGGVLSPGDVRYAAERLGPKYGINVNELAKVIAKYEKMSSCSSDYSTFLSGMESDFGIKGDEMMRALVELPLSVNFELARRLSSKYEVVIASNQMKFKTDYIQANYNLNFFRKLFFSSEIGCQKPGREFFDKVLMELGADASDCIFIDDSLKNVEMAKSLGIQGIHLIKIDELEKEFEKLGIIV